MKSISRLCGSYGFCSKKHLLLFIDYPKAFDCVDHSKWENLKTTLPVSWETCMQVKKQQLETDMEQLPGSKLGKEYDLYIVILLI